MTIPEIYSLFKKSTGITTDTRNVGKDQIFLALKGANFNGNEYAYKALELGASYVVIDEKEYQKDDRYILVHNALHTLQLLANYHRHQFDIPVFGITGTNGKTTTKELLTGVLSQKYKVTSTKGNLNNHIGVPLTLLTISDETEFAVIEMGANKIGDIRELCSFANPTHGAVINVGKAHLEGFGSFEGVIQTKTELYDFLYNSGKIGFVNGSQEELVNNTARFDKMNYFQNDKTNTYTAISSGGNLKVKTPRGAELETQLVGAYNVDNIALACQLGEFFGVEQDEIDDAITSYRPSNNRSQIIKNGSGTVLLDAYNANPFSMKVAIENLSLSLGGKNAILGDMFELGEYAEEEHKKVIEDCLSKEIEVVFCGELFHKHREGFSGGMFFKTREEVIEYLKSNPGWINQQYNLLIKGSRGMALEKILEEVDF